ncbi:MAG TPA: peptidylprolyl isomerase [Planctomycetaceae bacterium]|jgi:cyclophilin family peptidyl-prolyl cis-trans isomerase
MLSLISAWAKSFFQRHPGLRRRKAGWGSPYVGPAEVLELRTLLTVTLATPIDNDLPNDKIEYVAADVTNSTTNPVSFTVTSSNPNVTATVLTGGLSLDLNVSGVDSTGTPFTGDIVLRLFENLAPDTTAHIIQLAQSGFYNGLTFHRVISGFVAQGGDPTGSGSGGSGPGGTVSPIDDEFSTSLTYTSNGLLGMANSGHDTNDSQFFITAVDQTLAQLPQNLNFENPIFGIVTSGFDILNKLMSTPTDSNNKPLTNEVINSATVFTDTNDGVIELQSAPGFTGSTTITITANDGNGSTSQQQTTINVVPDTANDPPILGAVGNQVTTQGVPVTFTVQGIDLQDDPLTFVVKDPTSFATEGGTAPDPANVTVAIQVTPASGSTPSTATITLTPSVTFSGTINLIVGVRDQTTHNSATALDDPRNFDTQAITLTVNPINHAPTTPGGSVTTPENQAVNIQLTSNTGDPDKTQALTYVMVTPPSNGTISNFDASTGALTYTPTTGFLGLDTFTYKVMDDGGTANGGQDTSSLATFSITVGAPTLTGLALSTNSDDGVFNNDDVILNSTPTFTVAAPTDTTVTFLVNGTSQVTATETSPGLFSGTLTRQMLQVGANTITATGTLGGAASSPTAPLTFTYAPSDTSVYTVPGAFGSAQQITFSWTSRNAAFDNELGVFAVSDANGDVNGIAPGAAGYAAAALGSSTRQVLFAQGQTAGATKTINVTGGELLVFYLVSNNTTSNLLDFNPRNTPTGLNAFFSVASADPDHVNHVRTTADTQTGQVVMSWEDMLFGGDRDYNDAVITLTPAATASSTVSDALRISGGPAVNGTPQTVPVTFTLDPTNKIYGPSPAVAHGELGVVVVSDESGTINGLAPGSAGYLAAALGSSTRQVLFSSGDPLDSQKTLLLPAGALIEFYYIPNGTAASVLANNPTNNPSLGPVAFFSFDPANPDSAQHFRWFAPEGVAVPEPTDTPGQTNLLLHGTGQLDPTASSWDEFLLSISMPQ